MPAKTQRNKHELISSEMFALSLTNVLGHVSVGITTMFEGWADEEARRELRAASAGNDARQWVWLYENYSTVKTVTDLMQFLRGGGHALVHQTVAAQYMPWAIDPFDCQRNHQWMPYYARALPPNQANERFARRTLRQTVIQRDEGRCRVCGRSPDDALDIKLDVHHIVPYEQGSLSTVEHNLVTLCHLCHTGIDIEGRPNELAHKVALLSARNHRRRHGRDVAAYRETMRRFCAPDHQYEPAVVEPEWSEVAEPGGNKLHWMMLQDNLVILNMPIREWLKKCGLAGLKLPSRK